MRASQKRFGGSENNLLLPNFRSERRRRAGADGNHPPQFASRPSPSPPPKPPHPLHPLPALAPNPCPSSAPPPAPQSTRTAQYGRFPFPPPPPHPAPPPLPRPFSRSPTTSLDCAPHCDKFPCRAAFFSDNSSQMQNFRARAKPTWEQRQVSVAQVNAWGWARTWVANRQYTYAPNGGNKHKLAPRK